MWNWNWETGTFLAIAGAYIIVRWLTRDWTKLK